MAWTSEQYVKLLSNTYAKEVSNSLFLDVYPSIVFLMGKMEIEKLEFPLGAHHNNLHEFYKCIIVKHLTSLTIRFSKCIKVNVTNHLTGRAELKEETLEFRNFFYNPNVETAYFYYVNENDNMTFGLKDPVFCSLSAYYIDNEYENITEFYLFYCEGVVRLLSELKNTYRDGFLKLTEKINALSFPIERIVIFEKNKNNGF
jgi:hypothetical protein